MCLLPIQLHSSLSGVGGQGVADICPLMALNDCDVEHIWTIYYFYKMLLMKLWNSWEVTCTYIKTETIYTQ